MKTLAIAAAGLALLAGAVPGLAAPAAAQRTVVHERTVVRGPAPRVRPPHRVCRTVYRHHHRIRTCRTVRYR